MEVLVAEYASCGGYDLLHLLNEGGAMLETLESSFTRSGHRVRVPRDISDELGVLSQECDAGMVVAPDNLLADFTVLLETGCDNLGSPVDAIRMASDKLRCGQLLHGAGIPTPIDAPECGRWVIKPRFGCGCVDVRFSNSNNEEDGCVIEPYVHGEHLSACLVAAPSSIMPLSLNRQKIEIDGEFSYLGNMVNITHPRGVECMKVACSVAELIGVHGLCGVDIVLADEPYVVDVNPRMTTSFIGVAPLMQIELAELVLRAHRDDLPAGIELRGRTEFNLKSLPAVEVFP